MHYLNQMSFIVTWKDSSGKTNYQKLSTDNIEEAKKLMRRKGVPSRDCIFEDANKLDKASNDTKNENSYAKSLMDVASTANSNFKEGVGATILDAKANKIGKITLFLAAQLLVIGIIQIAAFVHSITPRNWEYRLETPSDYLFEDTMNDLGNEGWELVNARRATSKYKSGASYEMIFKKKKL